MQRVDAHLKTDGHPA